MLLVIGYAGQTIFTPAVCTRASLVVRKIIPRVTALAVVLPYGAPLPFTEIRSPFFPENFLLPSLFKPILFRVHWTPRALRADCGSLRSLQLLRYSLDYRIEGRRKVTVTSGRRRGTFAFPVT